MEDKKLAELEEQSIEAQKADLAFAIMQEIKQRKTETAYGMIRIGELLKRVRDEKLYTYYGCDTFAEFYGAPEVGLAQSTVYQFIDIYETFVVQFEMDPDEVATYEPSKLSCIMPRIKKNPDEVEAWLLKSKTLSRTDLKRELGYRVKPIEDYATPVEANTEIGKDCTDYDEWVRKQPCILCGRPSTLAHWPRTRVRGAFAIPLCLEHHREQEDAVKWVWFGDNFKLIGEFLDKVRGHWNDV